MKPEKAYDFFSAYFEGTLDPSLRGQMDRLMDDDVRLRDDFAAFAAAVDDLSSLRDIQITVPADLHETIAARVDKAAFDSSRNEPAGWLKNWRQLAFGGVAALAIVGAALSILPRGGQSGFGASPAPVTSGDTRLRVEATSEGAFLRYAPTKEDEVIVTRVSDGSVANTYKVSAERPLNVPVNNSGELPTSIRLSSNDGRDEAILALPGTAGSDQASGQGTLVKFAESMASYFRQPVLLESNNLDAHLEWTFDRGAATNPRTSLNGLTVALQDRLLLVRY